MEVHNRVEGKIDNMVDLKAVDTGLGVDNPWAHTNTGVAALEVRKNTGVDPGAHIGPGVDLEGCIVP